MIEDILHHAYVPERHSKQSEDGSTASHNSWVA
jgi:hypothetical protein